jgi:hypothetical protein
MAVLLQVYRNSSPILLSPFSLTSKQSTATYESKQKSSHNNLSYYPPPSQQELKIQTPQNSGKDHKLDFKTQLHLSTYQNVFTPKSHTLPKYLLYI